MKKEEENVVEEDAVEDDVTRILWDALNVLGRVFMESPSVKDRSYILNVEQALLDLMLEYT